MNGSTHNQPVGRLSQVGAAVMAPAVERAAAARSLPGLTHARRPELDLMRGLVVAGLVIFHSAVVFAPIGNRSQRQGPPGWSALQGLAGWTWTVAIIGFAALVAVSFAATLAVYELADRRFRPTRLGTPYE